ncbi:MAG: endolytic transglycosylase MltG [Gammaproteobacteria bacterium]|nr:endolytic transglycosylase MltG [Gammaproteobacteria bacterium]
MIRPSSPGAHGDGGNPASGGGGWLARVLFRLAGLLVLSSSLAVGVLWYGWKAAMETPIRVPDEGLIYEIPQGVSFRTIMQDLARRGIVAKPFYLRVEARYSGDAGRIKAGEYLLNPGLTHRQLLDELVRGEVIQHTLTLVEGWTFPEMMAAVAGHDKLQARLSESDPEAVMAALGRAGEHPEGRFLPETYHFPKGTTDVAFLAQAYRAMERVLAEEWSQREVDLPYETPYEALIMASIVEKETGQAGERSEVAGVFVRRLRRGMRLQTDPTLIYGLGADFDGNLRRVDLRTDTPYNTYTRHGLPPTPIAMPGRAAIHATLHPAGGEALYFVSRGDGTHHFSATLREHQNAVNEYQRGRRSP